MVLGGLAPERCMDAAVERESVARLSWWARRSTWALNWMIFWLSASLNAWMNSPTCSICSHRLARSMIRSSRREPSMRPYADSTALRCDSSSLLKIHARSRAGSLICMSCQLVTAVMVELENRTSPSWKPPWTRHVENDHNPSVSNTAVQLDVISGGICPA